METKQRHGCVTAWIILIIITNSIIGVVYLFNVDIVSEQFSNPIVPQVIIAMGMLGIVQVVFSFMLLQWKKWAFWGFGAISILILFINVFLGIDILTSLLGLSGVAILYGILQIKKDGVTAWENLE